MPEPKDKQEELEASRKEQLSKYCPLILSNCRADCACFDEGKIYKTKFGNGSETLNVRIAYCTHGLINGTIYVETN